MYTVYEMKEKLKSLCDEITILEVLDIRIGELLDRFEDKIENNLEALSEEFLGDFGTEGEEQGGGSSSDWSHLSRYFEEDYGYQIIGGDDDEEEQGL
jgi:hypothetical protein